MKYILMLALLLGMARGQDVELKFDNIITDNDTITVRIFTYGYPDNDIEFENAMEKLGEEIKFDDAFTSMSFWIYVSIMNMGDNYTGYEQSFDKVIDNMNWWFNERYKE